MKFPWTKQSDLPTGPVHYFAGTVVKTETGTWYIQDKTRLSVPNKRVLKSWYFPRVVQSTEAAVAKYLNVGKLGFRGGSLLFDISNGVYFLVVNNKLHLVDTPEIWSPTTYRLIGAAH